MISILNHQPPQIWSFPIKTKVEWVPDLHSTVPTPLTRDLRDYAVPGAPGRGGVVDALVDALVDVVNALGGSVGAIQAWRTGSCLDECRGPCANAEGCVASEDLTCVGWKKLTQMIQMFLGGSPAKLTF